MSCSKSSKSMVDFFSNVPDIVIDKILDKLPIRIAAQTSMLSKQWRNAWLSLEKLYFDLNFQEQQKTKDGSCNWRKNILIINSILFHHIGPVRHFKLYIPDDEDGEYINPRVVSQWISFLSKNGVQNIVISNCDCEMHIPSYIFWCRELVHLDLEGFSLNPPPTCFHGFPKLKHLELEDITFTKHDIFRSLIENCRMLVTLKLVDWTGMDHVVINVPSLRTLILEGYFESLNFRNVRGLESISFCLKTIPTKIITVETIDAVNLLAISCQLQFIEFDGHFCKFLAAGSVRRSPPVTFNYVKELRLSKLDLSDLDVFRSFLSMIECCPNIKKLRLSIIPGKNIGQHTDYNYNYKLQHLREISLKGITASNAQVKLVEYLLAITTSLENLFFKSGECSIKSELKMSSMLMRFPRASSKASIVHLGKCV